MARTDNLNHFLTDVADAIRTKAGTSGTIQASAFDTAIANIPSGGGGTVEEKDVNFYDYEGTLLHSYTAQEFQALESMPENPTHEGLTSQGWNWTLEQAKSYVTNHGICDIGQMYTPTDGKTKIYIHLEDGRTKPYLRLAVNGTVTVDWGDESATENIVGTSTSTFIMTPHEYSTGGDYIISLSSNTNFYIKGDTGAGQKFITAENSYSNSPYKYYVNSVIKVILSTNAKISTYTFAYMNCLKEIIIPYGYSNFYTDSLFQECNNLKFIVIPNTVNSLPSSMGMYGPNFTWNCYCLKGIVLPNGITGEMKPAHILNRSYNAKRFCIPDGVTSIMDTSLGVSFLEKVVLPKNNSFVRLPNSFMSGNYNLKQFEIPNTITTLGTSVFSECGGLTSLTFPSGLTTIGNSCFQYIPNIAYYDFSACLQVPTLGSGCFTYIADDCKIIVPNSLYNDWVATSGWSSYASYIISKSDWDALQTS